MVRTFKNQTGVPEEYLILLEEDLGQLAAVDPELPASLLRYVIDGEGPESVERLATAPRKEKPFVWPGVMVPVQAAPEKRARLEFFARPAIDDPHLYVRHVRVLQAIWRHNRVENQVKGGWAMLAEPSWLEVFFFELNSLRDYAREHDLPEPAGMTIQLLERMIAAEGQSADLLIRTLLAEYEEQYSTDLLERLLFRRPGLGESLVEHSPVVIAWLKRARPKARVRLLTLLGKLPASVEPFLEIVAKLAVGAAKSVREAAAAVLDAAPAAAAARLEPFTRKGKADERTRAAELLERFRNTGRFTVEPQQRPEHVPVEELRGLEEGIFGYEGKVMLVHAPPDDVRREVIAVRSRQDRQWGVWFVQLLGHVWTIVTSDEPLDEDVVSEKGAEEVSRRLSTDVLFCLTEDTSGVIAAWIFRAGKTLLKMDNMDGIAARSSKYRGPRQDPDEEPDEELEFDVKRHLDHYLRREGTYLPWIWPKVPPATGIGVTAKGLADADFVHAEYVPA